MKKLQKANRFEVIDHTDAGEGRVFTRWSSQDFQISVEIQDGKTVKIFLTEEA
jgi:hypothetical protein